jgi:hypothetical protein
MRPRRYRLRLYVRAVRALLSVLTAIDDWMLIRRYPRDTRTIESIEYPHGFV